VEVVFETYGGLRTGHGTVLVANIEFWDISCRVQKIFLTAGSVKETGVHLHWEICPNCNPRILMFSRSLISIYVIRGLATLRSLLLILKQSRNCLYNSKLTNSTSMLSPA
jgi:hypothetical protein